MKGVIRANSDRLKSLHDAVHQTFKLRDKSKEAFEAWQKACRDFHSLHDALAFPGGLDSGLKLLRKGDPTAVEAAICFLEVDPWFFRSGYIKEQIARCLKSLELAEDQKERIRQVILRLIDTRDGREFRDYCRLAISVDSPLFADALLERRSSGDADIGRRANWVLEALQRLPTQ